MSVKKNLTVATVMALLAVPAFSSTNASHALHIPSITAHAEGHNDNSGDRAFENDLRSKAGIHEQWYKNGVLMPDPTGYGNYNGHNYQMHTQATSDIWVDGKEMSPEQAKAILDGSASGTANNNSSSDNGSADDTSANGSQSSEYQNGSTNNGKLVQTGENDGASKAMALGASALVASAGLMAFSFARKHKYLESVDLASNTDTVSASNGKGSHDDTPKYSNKSSYDMIMGDTFNDLSKSLKNL